MSSRYIDFDAALAEASEEPVVVRYQGRDWELYSSIPAKTIFRIMRLEAEGRGTQEFDRGELLRLLTEAVPSEVLEAWLDSGISIDRMTRLLKLVMVAYRADGESDDESAEGKAPTAKKKPRPRSSSAGR